MAMSQCRRGRSGLTLVEVIVCVAVVAGSAMLCSCALSAAREKARRSACLNNLNQMAKGMESYCGDYSQYFPGYAAQASDPQPLKGTHWDMAMYDDEDAGQSVRTGNRDYYAGPSRYRCLFYGSRLKDAPGSATPPFSAGVLNVAPIGLGYLLQGNYVGDARTFFCVSATRVPKMTGYGALTEVKELQRVGGFDAQSLMYGDYSRDKSFYAGQSDRGVLSSYNYRGVPLAVDAGLVQSGATLAIPFTQPQINAEPGCPMFKTQKLLGGRAIVCDSFDRPSSPLWERGFTHYVHRDHYNVLFGDWSVRWYDDPAHKVMEMPWPAGTPTDASQGSDVCYWPATPTNNTALGIWNFFDMQNGIDKH